MEELKRTWCTLQRFRWLTMVNQRAPRDSWLGRCSSINPYIKRTWSRSMTMGLLVDCRYIHQRSILPGRLFLMVYCQRVFLASQPNDSSYIQHFWLFQNVEEQPCRFVLYWWGFFLRFCPIFCCYSGGSAKSASLTTSWYKGRQEKSIALSLSLSIFVSLEPFFGCLESLPSC